MSLIVTPEYSKYLYRTSYFSLVSCVYSIYNNPSSNIFLIPGGIFITSINYWRYPTNSYRRWIDITSVILGGSYQIYYASKFPEKNIYYSILLFGLIFYPIARYYDKKNIWLSTLSHMTLHLILNISNMYLYSIIN
jgi:hypothetical protein